MKENREKSNITEHEIKILKRIFKKTLDDSLTNRYQSIEYLTDDLLRLKGAKWEVLRRQLFRHKLVAGFSFSTALLLSCIIGFYVRAHLWSYHTYYADYVLKRGVPVGINELNNEERARRYAHYEIVSKDGKIRELAYRNSKGTLVNLQVDDEYKDRPIRALFDYNQDSGTLSETKILDSDGLPLCKIKHSPDYENYADIGVGNHPGTIWADVAAGNIKKQEARSSIVRKQLEYDSNGFVVREYFFSDNRDTPAADINGIYGVAYERDDVGRPVKVTYLDHEGIPTATEAGYASKSYVYDERGNHISTTRYDIELAPIFPNYGYILYFHDDYGNIINKTFYHTPLSINQISRFTYDNRNGFLMKQEVFKGQTVSSNNMIFRFEYEYNDKGLMIRERRFDASGEYAASIEDYAVCRKEYDEFGRVIELTLYDPSKMSYFKNSIFENTPLFGQSISSGIVGKSPQGKKVGEEILESFNINTPEVHELGPYIYKAKHKYENSNLISTWEASFIQFEKPIPDENLKAGITYNYLRRDLSYNSRGNISEERYRDFGVGPLKAFIGFKRFSYDENDNLIRQEYFGAREQPEELGGYHKWEASFDKNGALISKIYYDIKGNPVMLKHWSTRDIPDMVFSELSMSSNVKSAGAVNNLVLPDGGEIVLDRVFYDNDMIYVVCKLLRTSLSQRYDFENYYSTITDEYQQTIHGYEGGTAFINPVVRRITDGLHEKYYEIVYVFKTPLNFQKANALREIKFSINGTICYLSGDFCVNAPKTIEDEQKIRRGKALIEETDVIKYQIYIQAGEGFTKFLVSLNKSEIKGRERIIPGGSSSIVYFLKDFEFVSSPEDLKYILNLARPKRFEEVQYQKDVEKNESND
jgi:hypothetical protein